MFSFKKKKMEKDAKKLELIKETQEMWDKFQNVHNKVYSVKLSLKSLLNVKKEIKSKEMPLMLSKYCKKRGLNAKVKILKSQLILIKEDALIIQQSIETEEALLGLEKKTFEFPNLNDIGFNKKCNQFELLLESFEEEIKILKIEKERRGQADKPIKEIEDVDDCFSYTDELEAMDTLNRRLSIFFQHLFTIENGLMDLKMIALISK